MIKKTVCQQFLAYSTTIMSVVAVLMWSLIACLTIYNKLRDRVFFDGYRHGTRHAEIFINQKGRSPPLTWQSNAWRFVNTEKDWPVDMIPGSK